MNRDRTLKTSELMAGFPPNAEGQVTLANWRKAPFNKWSFTHLRELIPSAAIANDPGDVAELPAAPVDLDGVEIEFDGSRHDLESFLAETETDGMLVLREGGVVHEHYGTGHGRGDPALLRVRHEVGAGARRGDPRRAGRPRDGAGRSPTGSPRSRRPRGPARPSATSSTCGPASSSTRTISPPRAPSSSTGRRRAGTRSRRGRSPRTFEPGSGASPSRTAPTAAQHRLPLRLAQHRCVLLGWVIETSPSSGAAGP